jgi:5,10-methylenetetrahydrofolate reductase
VRIDESCEVDERRCPFLDGPVVRWDGPATDDPADAFARSARPAGGGPIIVIDLRVRPFDATSITAVTRRLSPNADLLLVGEHHVRPDFPPTVMASLVDRAGGRPWVTLTCRDRNRVVLESELAGLAALGAPGVHCVTGDARARSVREDATQVFDLDGTRLAALACDTGLVASVAATPIAPPTSQRPARIVEKQRAGAAACFVNHAGGAAGVAAFVAAARRAGATMPFVPCVPVFTDLESLVVLERFPGVRIDPAVRRAVLDSSDTRATGIDAAVDVAEQMLRIDGVIGINLSGSATASSEADSAAIMDEVAARIRSRVSSSVAEPVPPSPSPPPVGGPR